MVLRGELHNRCNNSKFEIFYSVFYIKSVSMPLSSLLTINHAYFNLWLYQVPIPLSRIIRDRCYWWRHEPSFMMRSNRPPQSQYSLQIRTVCFANQGILNQKGIRGSSHIDIWRRFIAIIQHYQRILLLLRCSPCDNLNVCVIKFTRERQLTLAWRVWLWTKSGQ